MVGKILAPTLEFCRGTARTPRPSPARPAGSGARLASPHSTLHAPNQSPAPAASSRLLASGFLSGSLRGGSRSRAEAESPRFLQSHGRLAASNFLVDFLQTFPGGAAQGDEGPRAAGMRTPTVRAGPGTSAPCGLGRQGQNPLILQPSIPGTRGWSRCWRDRRGHC